MATELSVRVRRIDDLPELKVDAQEDFFQLGDDDQFLVSHVRNQNFDTQANVSYARKITSGSLKTCITDHVKDQLINEWLKDIHISDLADGDNFMSEITKTLQDIKSQEQNSFMENSYHRETFYQLTKQRTYDGQSYVSAFLMPEGQTHSFLQDTNAYVHVSFRAAKNLDTKSSLDLMTVQVKSNDEGWYNICSEPINLAQIGAITEIDLHAFFYAGTDLRVYFKKLGTGTALTSTAFDGVGYISIVETSNEKPFPTDSFTWRSSIPINTTGTTIQKNTSSTNTKQISADGFINAYGKYCNVNTEGTIKAAKNTTIYDPKQAWNTPLVYIAQVFSGNDEKPKILGNTQNIIPYGLKSATESGFSGRYFYVGKKNNENISVLAFSDVRMNDDKGYSNVAGMKNQTTFNYYAKNELSMVLPGLDNEEMGDYLDIGQISSKFSDETNNYHIFKYGKLLGRPGGPALVVGAAKVSEYGTIRKSIAYAGVQSAGPNFIRSKKEDDEEWLYSIGDSDSGMYCPMVKKTVSESNMDGNGTAILSDLAQGFTTHHSGINKDQDITEEHLGQKSELCGSVNYEIDILDKNVTRLRCFPKNVSTFSKQLGTTDLAVKPYLNYQNLHDAGAPLTSVNFAKNSTACIDDSAFAFCTQLSNVNIPVGMQMNGNNTFDMGTDYTKNTYQRLKVTVSAAPHKVKKIAVLNTSATPRLKDVVFGYDPSRGEIFNGYPPESALIDIEANSNNEKILLNTFRSCISLTSVNTQFTNADALSGTFANCSSLTSVVFPQSMRKIYNTTFQKCPNLTSITFNVGLNYIATKAFDGTPKGVSTQNTPKTGDTTNGTYRLGTNYNFSILLPNKIDEYYNENQINKDLVWTDMKDTIKVLTNTAPFSGAKALMSRRIYILDSEGINLTDNKTADGNKFVFNPFKSTSDKVIMNDKVNTKKNPNWDNVFDKDNIRLENQEPKI